MIVVIRIYIATVPRLFACSETAVTEKRATFVVSTYGTDGLFAEVQAITTRRDDSTAPSARSVPFGMHEAPTGAQFFLRSAVVALSQSVSAQSDHISRTDATLTQCSCSEDSHESVDVIRQLRMKRAVKTAVLEGDPNAVEDLSMRLVKHRVNGFGDGIRCGQLMNRSDILFQALLLSRYPFLFGFVLYPDPLSCPHETLHFGNVFPRSFVQEPARFRLIVDAAQSTSLSVPQRTARLFLF